MKKGKLELGKKLFLNKERIAVLSKDQSAYVLGGATDESVCNICEQTQGCEPTRFCSNAYTDPGNCNTADAKCDTKDTPDHECASVYAGVCDSRERC